MILGRFSGSGTSSSFLLITHVRNYGDVLSGTRYQFDGYYRVGDLDIAVLQFKAKNTPYIEPNLPLCHEPGRRLRPQKVSAQAQLFEPQNKKLSDFPGR